MKMKKKYITPAIKVVNIEATSLMDGSTGIPAKQDPPITSVDDVW